MSLWEETAAQISAPDTKAASDAAERWARCISPEDDGLGRLKELFLQYAGITGNPRPEIPKKCTILCCADHGVAEMGVSAYPPETTVEMTANYLISRGSTANVFSEYVGSDLLVVDLGIAADTSDIPGLMQRKIAYGTQNCAKGPAMTRAQAIQSVETGIRIVSACAENGYRCFLPGEMGIANTTSSAAICSVLCGIPPEQVTGRGTNISEERLQQKLRVVEQALQVNRPDPADAWDVLSKVGGFELGCIAGIILGAAAHRTLVILDGFNTGAAALLAVKLAPACRDYLAGSQLADMQGHRIVLEKLGIRPCMDLQLRLGETAGSSVAAGLLDMAIRLCEELEASAEIPFSEFSEELMEAEAPVVTDKTFDFYLNTMPSPNRQHMEKCRFRIDHLAKPADSLGRLEQIAIQLAGILNDDRPGTDISYSLLCFVPAWIPEKEECPAPENPEETGEEEGGTEIEPGTYAGKLSETRLRMMRHFSVSVDADVTIGYLRESMPSTAAFDFGRVMAEDISFSTAVLGLAVMSPEHGASMGEELRGALLEEDGSLRWEPEEFLRHVPLHLRGMVSALMGGMLSAAHNSALVVLDDAATEIIARYMEKLCPEIRPYVLHTQPTLLQLDLTVDGGATACLGMKVVDAALHMLNFMKTFRESGVSIAKDGPGAKKQKM